MWVNLLDLLRQAIGNDFANQAARYMGEPEQGTRSAVDAMLPILLGGLVQKGATLDGANSLLSAFNNAQVDSGLLGNLGQLFSGSAPKASSAISAGEGLVSMLFGQRVSGLASALASMSGLRGPSATSLLALVTLLVFAAMKRYVLDNRVDASGLMSLLGGQTKTLQGALDSRLTSALGFATPGAFLAGLAGVAAATKRAGVQAVEPAAHAADWFVRRLLPWVAVAAIAILGLWMWRDSTQTVRTAKDVMTKALRTIELPGGAKVEVPQGGFIDALVVFLTSKDAVLGKSFTFDDLHFETGSATLAADRNAQVAQLAAVLAAFPSVAVSVEGYTDNRGDPAANKKLSEDRAAAVKAALTTMGVSATRVASAGFGEERPVAPNDTEEGRARNRRVEVAITKR